MFSQGLSANNIKLNESKEFTVYFLKNQASLPSLTMNNQPLEAVPTTKLLGAVLRTVPTNSKVFLPRFMIIQEM